MHVFTCENCGQLVYFENPRCLRCGSQLGFLPDLMRLVTLAERPQAHPALFADPGQGVRVCGNAAAAGCNWLIPEQSPDVLCVACALNRTIPDISLPGNRALWADLERAKRRLVYALLRFGLPVDAGRLAFDVLADLPEGPPVMTGHDDGLVTIALSEADPAERERRRVDLGEAYRSPLGHMRHEIGHFYWDRLVRDGGRLEATRAVFGDETADYAGALQRHYRDGPPPDWQDNFVSSYATAHPWEDFAETWAHYLHIVDTLDTAASFGLDVAPRASRDPSLRLALDFDPYNPPDTAALIAAWLPLTYAVNSLNRSMDQPDLYPFVLPDRAIEKLGFIHDLIADARRTSSQP